MKREIEINGSKKQINDKTSNIAIYKGNKTCRIVISSVDSGFMTNVDEINSPINVKVYGDGNVVFSDTFSSISQDIMITDDGVFNNITINK